MRDLDDLGVVAFMSRLTSNIGPPSEHRVENADHADTENIWRRREHVVHPGDAADCRYKRGNRTERRPRAGLDQVIVVLRLGVSVGHLGSLRLSDGPRGSLAVIPLLRQLRPRASAAPLPTRGASG